MLNAHFFFDGEEHPEDVLYGVERVTLMDDYKYIVTSADYEAVEMIRERYNGTEITEVASKQVFVMERPSIYTALEHLQIDSSELEPQASDYFYNVYGQPVLLDAAQQRIGDLKKMVHQYRKKVQRVKRSILLYGTVVCYEQIMMGL